MPWLNSVTGTGLTFRARDATRDGQSRNRDSPVSLIPRTRPRARAERTPAHRGHGPCPAEQWNGTAWTVTNTSTGRHHEPQLFAVSCAGRASAWRPLQRESATSRLRRAVVRWSWSPSPSAAPGAPTMRCWDQLHQPTSCTRWHEHHQCLQRDDPDRNVERQHLTWHGAHAVRSQPSGRVSCSVAASASRPAGGKRNDRHPFNGQASIGRTGYRMVASDGACSPTASAPAWGTYLGSMAGPAQRPVVARP